MMTTGVKRLTMTVALLGAGAYAVYTLRGPRGIPGFLERQEEIRRLQTQNADLERENLRKREQIERLKNSDAEKDRIIRERLKLLRPGEKTFIFGDQKKP
jgi:cell division protein FtsB